MMKLVTELGNKPSDVTKDIGVTPTTIKNHRQLLLINM